jgi:adenylyltransferase/sulfurtransferase
MALTDKEIERYSRHLSLPGFGMGAQERLKNSRVLVIGAGGLGCPALLYLAAAGVGRIVVADPDRVETSNLQRQTLFTGEDVGQFKAPAAGRRLKALNPLISIATIVGRFDRTNALSLVENCDVVIDGSDNFATRYLVNDACVMKGRPFVYAAIQGFSGQLSVFNWESGPTYRCLFPEPPDPDSVPTCAEAGVLGALPGLLGTLQACEAIKLLSGVGEPLSGRLLLWDALTMTFKTILLLADPNNRGITQLPPEGYAERTCAAVPVREMDVEFLHRCLADGQPLQVIDVRESNELVAGVIPGAKHLPLSLWGGDFVPEALDPAIETVVYCAIGRRSQRAGALLQNRFGFKNVSSLRGGFNAWQQSR